MRTPKLLLATTTLLLACGCGSIRLAPEVRSGLRAVRIAPVRAGEISYSGKLPPKYDVDDGNALLAYPATAPIGLVYELAHFSGTRDKKSQRLRQIFAKAKLDIPNMARAEFSRKLLEACIFPAVVDDARADAELRLRVGYGLADGFASSWTPWVQIDGVMVDHDGRPIWRKSVTVDASSAALRELPFPDPFADSNLLRDDFRAATEMAVEKLIDDLSPH